MELGVSEEVFKEQVDTRTDIKRVVSNVVIIDPKEKESIEGIAQKIRRIKDSEVAYLDSGRAHHTFSEMIDLLQNPESLWTLDDAVKSAVDPLLAYVSNRITDSNLGKRTDLEAALGFTVLKLMDKVRPRKKDTELKQGVVEVSARETGFLPFNPYKQLEELQKVGGCAGGGNNKNKFLNPAQVIMDSVTPRLGSSNLFEDGDQEWFSCPKCSYKADGPVGNTCPGCNLTKEEFAAEEGVVVCD